MRLSKVLKTSVKEGEDRGKKNIIWGKGASCVSVSARRAPAQRGTCRNVFPSSGTVTNLAAGPQKGDGQAATALENRDTGTYGVISIFLISRTLCFPPLVRNSWTENSRLTTSLFF